MRSILLTILLTLTLTFAASCARFSQGNVQKAEMQPSPSQAPQPQATSRFPTPAGLVNDYANVLDAESKTRLDALLTKLKTKSNIEFAVVTIETTKGEPIFDYSLALTKEWGLGPKDASGGGMLFLMALKDRRWRLQVSRSLEKDLPDDVCKKLGDESVPLYKKGDFAGGIEKYVIALIERLEKQRNFSLDN
jgi:uncharacterized protein